MTQIRDVFILDGVRTPIGRHRGALAPVRPDDLMAEVLRIAIERTKVPAAAVDDVLVGCANQAGEDNRNIARMALLLAGMPQTVPGITVNRLCASGLSAINMGAMQIACGAADVVVAGGVESMSRAPLVVEKSEEAFGRGNRTMYDTSLGWRFPNAKLERLFPLEGMGETAENLVERHAIAREDQDRFAALSHEKAVSAEEARRFDDERISISIPRHKGEPTIVSRDEGPRPDTTFEALSALKPAFRKNGTVTAGNSSTLNDGAACVVLASRQAIDEHGLAPMARWVGAKNVGVDPRVMGIGPVGAIRDLLARHGLALRDIDLVELNEAFAAQAIAVLRSLELRDDDPRVNVNGGAIALGHPLGSSGARISTTLLHEMRRRGAKRGIASLCVGVGQGVATLFERV